MADITDADILTLTAEIVASFVGNNAQVKAEEIPQLIRAIRTSLSEAGIPTESDAAPETPKPDRRAINKSITPDALISFIDGKPYKTLKRHLSRHGLDMKSYREQYGLPHDYPSVAPAYSASRSAMAKQLGLGARGRNSRPQAPAPAPAPAKRGRAKATAGK